MLLFLQLNAFQVAAECLLFEERGKNPHIPHQLMMRNSPLFNSKQGGWRSILLLLPLGVTAVNGNYREMV